VGKELAGREKWKGKRRRDGGMEAMVEGWGGQWKEGMGKGMDELC